MSHKHHFLQLKQLGIDTYKEAVVFMRKDCHVCRSEGFEVRAQIKVTLKNRYILATLYTVESDLLAQGEISLSRYAWELLQATEGDKVRLSHPKPLQSLSFVRSKIYGHALTAENIRRIIADIAEGRYTDIHIASFLTACVNNRLSKQEIDDLTRAMVDVGEKLSWKQNMIVDKHCIGGLPGNRTTLIIVPIVAAFGMVMPKTSSRAITSPAGTADTMETLAPVELSLKHMQKVVEQEGACIVCGGIGLSPADDILIRVERTMDLDSEGQLVASVLSKKIAAGSTHILVDMPVGPTAKIRSKKEVDNLVAIFKHTAKALGVHLALHVSDGAQPVGRGIGPALEARDVLAVLQNHADAPKDLRDHALTLAGKIIEFSPTVKCGEGKALATQLLENGKAWQKFQAICQAQGGLREPPVARYTQTIVAKNKGSVTKIDNRQLARLAKLAGAPDDKAAGITLHTPLNTVVEKNQALYTIHAESKGELNYALSLLEQIPDIIQIKEQ